MVKVWVILLNLTGPRIHTKGKFPQRHNMPDVFDADGSLNKAYVWGKIVAPTQQVLDDWGHTCTINESQRFGPRSRPAKFLRWIPKRAYDRIIANKPGWTYWEDLAAAMFFAEPPKKDAEHF